MQEGAAAVNEAESHVTAQVLCDLCCDNLAQWFRELAEEAEDRTLQLPDGFMLFCGACGTIEFELGSPVLGASQGGGS